MNQKFKMKLDWRTPKDPQVILKSINIFYFAFQEAILFLYYSRSREVVVGLGGGSIASIKTPKFKV